MDVSQFGEQTIIDTLIADAQPLELNGATCDTYYARLHGRRVFIKRLKEEYRLDPRYLAALEKEFKIGYRLEHKALPRYISFEQDAIVMDFVEGVTLTQFIAVNPQYFSLKKNIDRFMMQLLEGVKYLHQNSILHLDLKPDNIMISHIGNDVHIIDLGFCYSDAFNDTIGYTHSFAAPEQKGESNVKVGTYTDIFAIGKILEYILTKQKRNSYLKVAQKCQNIKPQQRLHIDTLLSLFSHSKQWNKFILLAIAIFVGMIITIVFFVNYYGNNITDNIETTQPTVNTNNQNITHSEIIHDSINITSNLSVKPPQVFSQTSHDSINHTPNTNINTNNAAIKKTITPAPYKYPTTDYPYQSKHSNIEVKKDWYRALRPIYDNLVELYSASDSIAMLYSNFHERALELIENEKSVVYKKHSATSTDDIYNDGMHVYTMILWMHEGLPVEISGYKRPPRPDLTKYANAQISLFER